MSLKTRCQTIVDRLKDFYGAPAPPRITDPFEMILHENVAYLVDDARRDQAFDRLKKTIGTQPADILSASPEALNQITSFGHINRHGQVAKLVKAAQIALQDFGGDLAAVLERPINQARQARAALKKFPGIGDPGADKILLFNKKLAVLALDSNGLRVLARIGYVKEGPNYAATYRAAQQAIVPELPSDFEWLISAHQLLRRHGKELCKRTKPNCGRCPLARGCDYITKEAVGR
jgi:endonuclease III